MRSLMLTAMLGSCVLPTACSQSLGQTSQTPAADYVVGKPIRYKNLAIFPVLSKTEQNSDRYITLDEGLRAHTVEIVELGPANAAAAQRVTPRNANAQNLRSQQTNAPVVVDPLEGPNEGNQVNQLMVVNHSGKPLYLMPGEVIVGGSQDRTIGEETEIASTGKPVPIDVFCVEHGRWGIRALEETGVLLQDLGAARTAGEAKPLAAEARKGKFVATPGPLGKAGRVAVQGGKGQGEVWDNVAKTNSALRVDSNSGAFTATYASKSMRDELEPYVAALSAKVAATGRIVGAVVVVNGKIESVDVFASTPLFRKLWPKLLKSYAIDAVGAASVKKDNKGVRESSVAEASAFLAKVLNGSVRDTKQTTGGLVVTHREASGATSYSARVTGGGMGGAPIHAAGFAP
jgi:hypothetical protein